MSETRDEFGREFKNDAGACSLCDGVGMRVTTGPSGGRVAEPCECVFPRKLALLLRKAKIPARYQDCTLSNYQSSGELYLAYNVARRFVEVYPGEHDGTGLLFTGSIGVGKTHLAAAILRALVTEKAVAGLFCDYRELLKSILNSYNPSVADTELAILKPVFEAEVLVIDELGAAKTSEWVWETVALILNTRYNDRRTTILTTNYPDLPPGAAAAPDNVAVARASTREETLGDRIGERMRSRLQEMCVRIEMRGSDYRQMSKRARFR